MNEILEGLPVEREIWTDDRGSVLVVAVQPGGNPWAVAYERGANQFRLGLRRWVRDFRRQVKP